MGETNFTCDLYVSKDGLVSKILLEDTKNISKLYLRIFLACDINMCKEIIKSIAFITHN